MPKEKHSNHFDQSLLKTSVNMCRFAETLENNTLLKQVFRSMDICHPFEMKCPFRKVNVRKETVYKILSQ